jgi:hypothetical protein
MGRLYMGPPITIGGRLQHMVFAVQILCQRNSRWSSLWSVLVNGAPESSPALSMLFEAWAALQAFAPSSP